MDEDYTTMPDEELAEKAAKIDAERARRAVVTDAERRTDDLCLDYLRAAGRTNGGLFEVPVGFIGAYPRGWRVNTSDGVFEAAAPGITTAPPGDDWVQVDPDEPLIDFWEDRAYAKGEQARDAGRIWTAASDVHGARPSEFPGGWQPAD